MSFTIINNVLQYNIIDILLDNFEIIFLRGNIYFECVGQFDRSVGTVQLSG